VADPVYHGGKAARKVILGKRFHNSVEMTNVVACSPYAITRLDTPPQDASAATNLGKCARRNAMEKVVKIV
jgi:hypothetical protein